MQRYLCLLIVVVAVGMSSCVDGSPTMVLGIAASAPADATYTSPSIGFQIAWSLPWHVKSDNQADDVDSVVLSDFSTQVSFFGGKFGPKSGDSIVQLGEEQLHKLPTSAGVQELPANRCTYEIADAARCFTYSLELSSGSSMRMDALVAGWVLGNGIGLVMIAQSEEELFTDYLSSWSRFSVVGPGSDLVPPPSNRAFRQFRQQGARFIVQTGVAQADLDLVVEGTMLAQAVFTELDAYPPWYRTIGLFSGSSSNQYLAADTNQNDIRVFLGSEAWETMAPIQQIETIVHEMFHVYQFDTAGDGMETIPIWITEGMAEAVAYDAVADLGVSSIQDFVDFSLYLNQQNRADLPLCDYTAAPLAGDAYPLAYLAVQLILERSDLTISAIGDFYQELRLGESMEQAFQSSFGISFGLFCLEAESWQTRLPVVFGYPADFGVWKGQATPSTVYPVQTSTESVEGGQAVFVVETKPASKCHFQLDLKEKMPTAHETFANGSGEAFWLVTIPYTTPPGTVSGTVDCGAGSLPLQVVVTSDE